MTKGELAKQYFLSGCNCAQAVVMAFADEIDINKKTLLRMASSFGGGFGRMGEVCGAFSGVAMVIGYLCGYDNLKDLNLKKTHYAIIQELGAEFKSENGSLICRELLQGANITPTSEPSPRTDGYYKKRPCADIVESTANMLESKLNTMISKFERSLANGEFQPYFQAKVAPSTNSIIGAESLVRWIKDEGEVILPERFVPVLERDGLISKLDTYIFTKVCKLQKERLDANKSVVPISVNISRADIYAGDIVTKYTKIIDEIGVPKKLVPLELTETATKEGQEIFKAVERFAESGFTMSLDDFGTGFSSMASMSTLPFSVVKFDKTLSDQIGSQKGNVVIEHLVKIVKELGMQVVAEGIETTEQVEFLKQINCDMIQGYYYCEPVHYTVFDRMLDKGVIEK